jgi:hypothetical protein
MEKLWHEKSLTETIDDLPNDLFWKWVSTWLDPELIMEIVSNWDEQTQKEEIQNIRKIRLHME